MGKARFDGSKEWYLGLDIGTNSIGWAATDTEYNVLKFKGNATWGVYLFDEANTSEARRMNRTARRRLSRKKQRVALLREFFAREISKVDPRFYIRLRESGLWADDRTTDSGTSLFVGGGINDKEYNRQYPTIHHLICELMNSSEYHDPRLVYMACSYILSHRGHFLYDVSEENVEQVISFDNIYEELLSWFSSMDIDIPWNCTPEVFRDVLLMKTGVTNKEKSFYQNIMHGKKPKDVDSEEDSPISVKCLISMICGRKVNLAELFHNEEYKELDNPSVSISSTGFDEELENLSNTITDAEYDLLFKLKKLYDWSVLVDILNGKKCISEAKVKTYCQHKDDLDYLKKLIRNYLPNEYDRVFRACGKEKNYSSYSYNSKGIRGKEIPKDFEMATQEEFCKFVLGIVSPLEKEFDSGDDAEAAVSFLDMMERLKNNTFCPKQMTSDNRVIPYQLYYYELKKILDNASEYLDFLNESDEYGTVKDKILTMMKFRIPYYVGPLNSYKNPNAWMKRKDGCKGKIYPWNFDDMVDLESSEEEFIRRMTCKCSYYRGEDVLPKNSLLYSKFEVLNEINNIRVNEKKISVDAKQDIYESLFMRRRTVTVKAIRDFLIANGYMQQGDRLSGIDTSIKSSLKSYHDFKKYISSGRLSESEVEEIINRMTLTTDKARLRKWLKENFKLKEDEIKDISKLKYKDFGRLSERLLTEVYDIDFESGNARRDENIIQMLWNTNDNFMMLMSSTYGYSDFLMKKNEGYDAEHPLSLDDRLREMYISNSVKRPIIRTLEIVKELKKIFNCAPKKVFIEMARGNDGTNTERKKSRRDQIKELYANYDSSEVSELLSQLETKSDSELRSEKLFLYFIQLGKCMYSGNEISISDIGNRQICDVDHIWPQSKIKDDSLDNKVLVLSRYNGEKSDSYPINEEWRKKMYPIWKKMHEKKLISDKKYERLTRPTPFTDEELAQFINRQLVETRQSTKAVAQLLTEIMPESRIVYVKAQLTSDFRNEFKNDYYTLKCRDINDYHHAKDAYLNIVMGNIYDVKYTANPINFIKSGEIYTLRMRSMLNHDVERNGIVAWRAKDDIWFERVINTLHKNNIRFVRYSYIAHGELFDLMPLRKGSGQVPRKKELADIDKYGGYNKPTVAGYYLVSHEVKGERCLSIVDVAAMHYNPNNTLEDIIDYCKYKKGLINPQIMLNGRIIKINSLWEIDGYRACLARKNDKQMAFRGSVQLVLPTNMETYIHYIYSYCEKVKEAKNELDITSHDKLDVDTNIELYDLLTDKINNTRYVTLMSTAAETLINGREKFIGLPCEKQVIELSNIIRLFRCNDSGGKDLTLIGGAKASGIQLISCKLSAKRFKDIRIIDQSPTGLFEKSTPNLLTL